MSPYEIDQLHLGQPAVLRFPADVPGGLPVYQTATAVIGRSFGVVHETELLDDGAERERGHEIDRGQSDAEAERRAGKERQPAHRVGQSLSLR